MPQPAISTPVLTEPLVLDDIDAVLLDIDSARTERDLQTPDGPAELLRAVRTAGCAIGVVSRRRHRDEAPGATDPGDLVDVWVDDIVAAALALPEPPDPATYLEVTCRLGVDPARVAVIVDRVEGTCAGRDGGFGRVIGVGEGTDAERLRASGAHDTVQDLHQIAAPERGPLHDGWHLTYRPSGDRGVGVRETLCTLGNGYFATRGARLESPPGGEAYPGTYVAGVFNRLTSFVDGQRVERESMVKAPNWLPVTFCIDSGPFLGQPGMVITDEQLRLDLRSGMLLRTCRVTDPVGRRTRLVERRVVSMDEPHLAGIQLQLIAENWAGLLTVRSSLDLQGCASQTTESRLLAHCHLRLDDCGVHNGEVMWLAARTTQSDVVISEAARTRVSGTDSPVITITDETLTQEFSAAVVEGGRCCVEKTLALYTSRDRAISSPTEAARAAAAEGPDFPALLSSQGTAWERLWATAQIDARANERPAHLAQLHLFHLLQVASPHVEDLDVGLGARGLHGEGYDGHVFWDETFVFPVLTLQFPRVARALLEYRRRRLPAARRAATLAAQAGARFPWQSASDGTDQTPTLLYNPRADRWIPDRSAAQRHVGLAVAYNCLRYLDTTGDDDFRTGSGAEMVFEVARHFAYLADVDERQHRFHIRGVMGPDEFHDGYPWADTAGVDDNAYTNVLAAWVLQRAVELADDFARHGHSDLLDRFGVDAETRDHFNRVGRGLYVPFHDGVISQFAGYEWLEPFDLDSYRSRYGNISRLDLILDAEGDSVRRYQVAKQADTVMLFYLLSRRELDEVFTRLGYRLSDAALRRTVDYYRRRVSHGSTLSEVVYAWVHARTEPAASWRYLRSALAADMADTQGGTTREGIHLGAMASTVDALLRCYTGLETSGGVLRLDPELPAEVDAVDAAITIRSRRIVLHVTHSDVQVVLDDAGVQPMPIEIAGRRCTVHPGQPLKARYAPPSPRPATVATAHDQKAHMMTITVDPVCGMALAQAIAPASTVRDGTTYYFCSTRCLESFSDNPAAYIDA